MRARQEGLCVDPWGGVVKRMVLDPLGSRGGLSSRLVIPVSIGETLEGTHTLVEIVEKPCSDLLAHTTEVCKVSRGDELPA